MRPTGKPTRSASPMAHRRGRVIDTDARRLLVLHVSRDDQEREQGSEDDPNVEAHQSSSPPAIMQRPNMVLAECQGAYGRILGMTWLRLGSRASSCRI
jgi:hypothetical protein